VVVLKGGWGQSLKIQKKNFIKIIIFFIILKLSAIYLNNFFKLFLGVAPRGLK